MKFSWMTTGIHRQALEAGLFLFIDLVQACFNEFPKNEGLLRILVQTPGWHASGALTPNTRGHCRSANLLICYTRLVFHQGFKNSSQMIDRMHEVPKHQLARMDTNKNIKIPQVQRFPPCVPTWTVLRSQ